MTRFAVVCTTIGDGSFLKHYAAALKGADAVMYVIPDRKSPKAIYEAVHGARRNGLDAACPDPISQAEYTLKLGAPDGFFPWDTDHRRNVGYLMAYESGADVVISIDDDNLPQAGWLKAHEHALTAGSMPSAVNYTGFANPCDRLDSGEQYYWPRGYPYGKRIQVFTTWKLAPCKVSINEGLWDGEPDVDAITRIALHPNSSGSSGPFVLGEGMWAPVNSQNTAVRREVIPAYYFFASPRFGDIYQGYLAQACAKHLGYSVRFGTPVVRHERNEHDLLADLEAELPDIRRLDPWLDWLTSAKPEGGTYAAAYASLADSLTHWGRSQPTGPEHTHWVSMARQMREWLKLCERISG